MERIKVALISNMLIINGISTMIHNLCRGLDKDQFEITVISGSPIVEGYRSDFARYHVSLIELPVRKKRPIAYYAKLLAVLRRNKFDVVHVNGNSATMALELSLAQISGSKVCIAHCHTTACKHPVLHRLMVPLFSRLYDAGFACSEAAGSWIFCNKAFYVIPNGFDTERFCFDEKHRTNMRNKLAIKDSVVIGHLGRFNDLKNQSFLLDVFRSVGQECANAKLLLVGTGPMFSEIQEKVSTHPYRDHIILYGETNAPEELYAAMDVFVLPSKREGLGIVLLEAQINGLNCVVSDNIPREVDLTGNVDFLSLNMAPELWGDMVLKRSQEPQKERALVYRQSEAKFRRYDYRESAAMVGGLYRRLLKEKEI